MSYQIEFYNSRFQASIEAWQEGIGRAFYCMQKGQRIIILHGFIKKSQATSQADLKIARSKLKEVNNA